MSTMIHAMTTDTDQIGRDRAMLRTLMHADDLAPLDMAERIGGVSASEIVSVLRGEPVDAGVHRRIHRFLETPGPEWVADTTPKVVQMPPRNAQKPQDERKPISPAHFANPDIAALPDGFVTVRNQRGQMPYLSPVLVLTSDYRLRLSSEALAVLGQPTRVQLAVNHDARQLLIRVIPDAPDRETFGVNGFLIRTARIGAVLRGWGLTQNTPYPLVAAHGGLVLEAGAA